MREELGVIELPYSLISEGGTQQLLEAIVKLKGEVWKIYRYDADPFPSNPHAHNAESGLTMDLSTGTLFRGRKPVTTIDKKALLYFREKVREANIPLPVLKLENSDEPNDDQTVNTN